MSHMNRERYRRKLKEILCRAEDESFFELVWAVDALQSKREKIASKYIDYPSGAATDESTSTFALHKWELETLIGQLLLAPKVKIKPGLNRITNCTRFNAAASAVSILRKLENAEAGIYLKSLSVLNDLPRIGHRQFPWQIGYYNINQFYRYNYIYGQGECADYFRDTYGLSIGDFSVVGFGLFAHFLDRPWIQGQISIPELGVTPNVGAAALALLSMPIKTARVEAVRLVRDLGRSRVSWLPTAYHPSLLRQFPIITFGENRDRLRAPLPELILFRITAGLYYDLIKGGSHLRNIASLQFEKYCRKYISKMMNRFNVCGSYRYKIGRRDMDAPDVLIKDRGLLAIAVECKATKLTYNAQFADDPIEEARLAYDEIAKGIYQIWRYLSHVRRGFAAMEAVSPSVQGMVLTLDTWLVMSREQERKVFAAASVLADRDAGIIPEDRRAVIICSIQDLETTLSVASEDSFLRVVAAASEDRFFGWLLSHVHRETEEDATERRPFPFELGDVVSWWSTVGEGGGEAKVK